MERFIVAAASGSSCNGFRSRDAFATCSIVDQPTVPLRSGEQLASPLANVKQSPIASQTFGS